MRNFSKKCIEANPGQFLCFHTFGDVRFTYPAAIYTLSRKMYNEQENNLRHAGCLKNCILPNILYGIF